MNPTTAQLLFPLLRSAICGSPLEESAKDLFSDEALSELFSVAKKHDLAHLLSVGLEKSGLLTDEQKEKYRVSQVMFQAAYRYEQMNAGYTALCDILEEAEIPFVPLKGTVLRAYYPEPWMRTSCDIDILVHEEDVERTVGLLTTAHGYTYGRKTTHDVSLYLGKKMHVEFHFTLAGSGKNSTTNAILQEVWSYTVPKAGKRYHREMTDDMFYFYHIGHMVRHFYGGGCGIRPFMDLWILEQLDSIDREKRDALTEKGDIGRFARVVRGVSEVWFGSGTHDEITRQVERYILDGGVYGSAENRISVEQKRHGGRLRFALSKLFLPYDSLKIHYPILGKYPFLTPVMEVRRWGKLLFGGKAGQSVRELTYSGGISKTDGESTGDFLGNIGL